MKKRIYHVLLISSSYDAFILEDDGRIDEQIFNEYVSLNLRYPPQFLQVCSKTDALETLKKEKVDLIISMLSPEESDTFELAKELKSTYPDIPIVVLTPFSREVSIKLSQEDLSPIDHIFSWLGNADILLAIIKLIEDKMNADHDVNEVGVQAIILVEDSIRFYSSYLPNIYKIIFKQSRDFMTEGLNEHQQMLRMRGRPKILLAHNYEEAIIYYERYKHNILGIISDISYLKDGELEKEAGFKLAQKVKKDDEFIPVLLQSNDLKYKEAAQKLNLGFISKNSKTLSYELKNFIIENFAFGDFVFSDPDSHQELVRVQDLKALQERLFDVPDNSLFYHLSRNHFSRWLKARALFPLADLFRDLRLEDFQNLDEIRRFIFDAIASFRLNKARGVIAQFNRESFDEYLMFTRIGMASIGGKARGLAFIDSLIKRNRLFDKYEDVIITIPRTVVLGTDVFDEFMEENDLYNVALTESFTNNKALSDEKILDHFVNARLPFRIHEDLYTLISVAKRPIAIRSSSLLEDSHYQPFAGIYSTYMIPNIASKDERRMIEILSDAIKSVYASAYFHDSKAYMTATSNVIDEEKMGIVLQEVCGQQFDNKFYPAISGVARSINFYPIPPEKPEDGIVNVAFGLGKYIVDGGQTLRFSPKYPQRVLQLTNPQMALRETQKHYYALDMDDSHFHPSVDDGINILKLNIKDVENDNSLKYVASTYDIENNVLRDGIHYDGKKLITFSNILNHNIFPLASILQNILEVGQQEMNKPIEIEFAVDLNPPKGQSKVFYILQIRPIVDNREYVNIDLDHIAKEGTIVYSCSSLGNGIIENLYDIVYIRPDKFDPANNPEVAARIGKLNDQFIKEKRNYILIGPGRWGSTDPWLGIPVRWPQISAARVIVESGLENYRIDPSQGTHFFQNLTSFRVGYFTINPYVKEGFYDLEYLSEFNPHFEDEFIRHIRFDKPVKVLIDGRKNVGVILKPSFDK
ncbi:PEP/pyruvate-binding domain-containing protein [candidate division KSB1 bacterium]